MLLFRSEEHVERWLGQWKRRKGATLTLRQGWGLAQEWYSDRLSPDWRPKTAGEVLAAFSRLGLRGEFWRMG
jgi:hypothetical protein